MFYLLEKTKLWIADFAKKIAAHKFAVPFLGIISFFEAVIFPIPPDIFLASLILAGRKAEWFFLSMLVSVSSVVGGFVGYALGYFLFDSVGKTIIEFYNLTEAVALIGDKFRDNAFWAIFLAGFTPIPYKIFTVTAGFFGVNLFTFALASLVSRALRFVLVGALFRIFGDTVSEFLFVYFNRITLGIGILGLGYILYASFF